MWERIYSAWDPLNKLCEPQNLVESRTGAAAAKLRFQSPLVAPDMRISRIRRSDEAIMLSPTESCASSRKAF